MSNFIKVAVLLVCAVVVALIVRIVVQSATRPKPHVVAVARVRIASADLPAGLLLRDADLGWKDIPVEQVPAHAVVDGAHGGVELKGSLLRHAVAAGAPIVADDVILPGATGFLAATLHPGMRAVSVAIDDVSGNAGLIEPGDYVDLLLTQQMNRALTPDQSVSSETVVQHVRVLAVGSEIRRPKDDRSASPSEFGNRARTVTLEVTPHMAEVVSVAARLGSLSLALRSFALASREAADSPAAGSEPGAQPAPVWAGDISRAVRQMSRAASPSAAPEAGAPAVAPTVVVYRGSQKSTTDDSTLPRGAPSSGSLTVSLPPLPAVPMLR